MTTAPAHAFLGQRLAALMQEAATHGIARDVAVAVLIDLVTASDFNDAAPDPAADSAPLPPKEPGPSNDVLMVTEKNTVLEQIVNPTQYF